MKFRLALAAMALLVELYFGGAAAWRGQWLSVLGYLLTGIFVAAACILSFSSSLLSPVFKLCAGVIGVIGLVSVLHYNRAFNVDLQVAYGSAASEMLEIENDYRPMTPELSELLNFGVKACSLQGGKDQLGGIGEVAKGIHYGPTMSLIDSAAQAAKSDQPNYCARAVEAVLQLDPNAFSRMDSDERKALLDAAK